MIRFDVEEAANFSYRDRKVWYARSPGVSVTALSQYLFTCTDHGMGWSDLLRRHFEFIGLRAALAVMGEPERAPCRDGERRASVCPKR